MNKIYQHTPEIWDKATCEKKAKRIAKDGLGTPYPFKGYIGSSAKCPATFGVTHYNGGCIRNDEWYAGEDFPFPILAEGFEIVRVPTWGWRIVKK